ncbi:uncharacterized protein C8R40DRAFT_1067293 [Lentinula edodes]|uniref:uncharacterized protein n=1 Tax=Lentinula edodes TaxID=5353 RepID=UPI001E8D716A|nr:uncharacterized protein C8R40DRAFT_1067293 [Lentinula edodes]KAH7878263.1 hypothetical protein C8R40DRAFT_1067293 [Lentinula edodes]
MPDPPSSSNFEPPPQNNESSSRKRRRFKSPNTQTNTSSAGPSKKSRRSHKATPKPTGKEKRKSDMYHIKSGDIPDDARGLKRAFEIHIRILWNSLSESVAPETPSNIDIANFMKRFSSHKQVDEVLNQPKVSLSRESLESVVSLRKTCQLDPGTIASAVAQVSDHSLRMTFSVLSSFGLTKWRPDVLGASPTSFYNLAIESIAISSFELGLQNGGYVYFEPNLEYIDNTAFLCQIYRNYVYSHLRKLILKKSREKGRLASDAVKRVMYKRRKKLMKSRIKYAQDSGFNNRIKSLIAEPECNSEDEDADDGSLHILVKNLRSENTSHFIAHEIDKGIRTVAELSGSKRHSYKKKTRKPHPDNKKSIFRKLPKNCALDWFQPEQFNSLPAQIRKRYVDAHIALPPFEKRKKLKVAEWGLLSEDSFMKKYGNEVRKLYKFPTKEELEAMENGQSDSDMSSDNDDAMDEDGDEGEAV